MDIIGEAGVSVAAIYRPRLEELRNFRLTRKPNMNPGVPLFVFLVATGGVMSKDDHKHSRSRRDFGCLAGNLGRCRARCLRLYPGSLGYCQGTRCMCETFQPVGGGGLIGGFGPGFVPPLGGGGYLGGFPLGYVPPGINTPIGGGVFIGPPVGGR